MTPPSIVSGQDHFRRDLLAQSKAIQMAIPAGCGVTADRVIASALLAFVQQPGIRGCTYPSIMSSVLKAAQLGLDPSGTLGEAYLVPFKTECTLIVGYQGMISLARRSGHIVTIEAHCVFENDEFTYELGLEPKLIHKPELSQERGDVVCAYAVAHLVPRTPGMDGGSQFEVMSLRELRKIQKTSKVWKEHTIQMYRKTVIRRLFNYLPKSVIMFDALANNDRVEFDGVNLDNLMVVPDKPDVIDVKSEPAK
jgi:recombination protein RecT